MGEKGGSSRRSPDHIEVSAFTAVVITFGGIAVLFCLFSLFQNCARCMRRGRAFVNREQQQRRPPHAHLATVPRSGEPQRVGNELHVRTAQVIHHHHHHRAQATPQTVSPSTSSSSSSSNDNHTIYCPPLDLNQARERLFCDFYTEKTSVLHDVMLPMYFLRYTETLERLRNLRTDPYFQDSLATPGETGELMQGDPECPICMNSIVHGVHSVITPCCGKYMHVCCAVETEYMSRTPGQDCPMCRQHWGNMLRANGNIGRKMWHLIRSITEVSP